jgi:hypothetical protein
MLQRKSGLKQLYQKMQAAGYHRRLRWGIKQAAARFHKLNPQWSDYFFDIRFLLNRGLPIVEEYIAAATSTGAIDLALAWAEEWPSMNASQRKACLQAQTVIAAEFLRLVAEAMVLPHAALQDAFQEGDGSWRGVGTPLAYLQAHNPPVRGRSHQHQPPQERQFTLHRKKGDEPVNYLKR